MLLAKFFKKNQDSGGIKLPWADLGRCYVTYSRQWKLIIFEVFKAYEIFFGSTILSRSCGRHQKFDHKLYKCSIYPGNEDQSPDFDNF